MDEKKILEKIKESAGQVDVPKSLKPDQIEQMAKRTGQNKRKLPVYKIGAAAAVLLITLVALWQVNHIQLKNEPSKLKGTVEEGNLGQTEAAQAEDFGAEKAVEEKDAVTAESGQEDASGIGEGVLPHVASEEELYAALVQMNQSSKITGDGSPLAVGEMVEESSMDRGTESAGADSAASTNEDYSVTNIQEQGVEEGDIVKTDGAYLYVLSGTKVRLIKTEDESMEVTGEIQLPDTNVIVEEMYLDGDIINLIATGSESFMEEEEADLFYINRSQFTRIYTYDISNRKSPKLKGSVEQEGYYRTSRKNGDYMYLFTEYTPVIKEVRESSAYLPHVDGERMVIDDIYLPPYASQPNYLVISSMDVNQPEKIVDHKAIVSAAAMFYVSTDNIYISNNEYGNGGTVTQIIKFSYQSGTIKSAGIGEVNGYLNDSFSLNENGGYLRVVATDWDNTSDVNHLYILDKELNICGKIENLAPGETIRSARFFGDMGYFVTFRETDPLFSVDLSDPEAPKVLGELKITGFSSYLHFYGEDKLLGLGNEVDPETGSYKGIKLSMFDISDPSDVKEIDKYVIKDSYDCPGLYNYKAIMIDPKKNILGFECEGNYMVFSYDGEKGFVNEFFYEKKKEEEYPYNLRGIYIGQTLYLSENQQIKAFDMERDFEEIGELIFKKN